MSDKKKVFETDKQINRPTEGWKASNKRYQIWTAKRGEKQERKKERKIERKKNRKKEK
jgi:hypothetical protein